MPTFFCPWNPESVSGQGLYSWTHVKAKDTTKSRRGLVIANTPGECVEGVAAMAGQQEAGDGREEGSVRGTI